MYLYFAGIAKSNDSIQQFVQVIKYLFSSISLTYIHGIDRILKFPINMFVSQKKQSSACMADIRVAILVNSRRACMLTTYHCIRKVI